MADIKAIDLFQAYLENKIPQDHGLIFQTFFEPNMKQIVFEYILYSKVNYLYLSDEGITFQTSARKINFIIETPDFAEKAIDPFYRSTEKIVPFRLSNLKNYNSENGMTIRYNNIPIMIYGLFLIEKSKKNNFSFIFPMQSDSLLSLSRLVEKTLEDECKLPLSDVHKLTSITNDLIEKTISWKL